MVLDLLADIDALRTRSELRKNHSKLRVISAVAMPRSLERIPKLKTGNFIEEEVAKSFSTATTALPSAYRFSTSLLRTVCMRLDPADCPVVDESDLR